MVAVIAAVVVALGIRMGGDNNGDERSAVPTTTPNTDVTASTVPPPTSTTSPPKPRTVTSLSPELGPGTARLVGVVAGPEGPVPGATVRVERLLGDVITTATVMTDNAGNWALGDIRGGRYRVRAWRPPDLAGLEPTVFFLTATETKTVGLTVTRYGTDNTVASIDPNPPVAGRAASLVVTLSTGGVDATGVLRAVGRPNVPVQLVPGPGLVLESAAGVVTDRAGNAAFTVRCTVPGSQPAASAVVAGVSRTLQLPVCAG